MILPVQRVPRYKLLLQGALCHIIIIKSLAVFFFSKQTTSNIFQRTTLMLRMQRVRKHTQNLARKHQIQLTIHAAALTVISEAASHMNSVIADLVRDDYFFFLVWFCSLIPRLHPLFLNVGHCTLKSWVEPGHEANHFVLMISGKSVYNAEGWTVFCWQESTSSSRQSKHFLHCFQSIYILQLLSIQKFIGRGRVTFVPRDRKEERILFLVSNRTIMKGQFNFLRLPYHIYPVSFATN